MSGISASSKFVRENTSTKIELSKASLTKEQQLVHDQVVDWFKSGCATSKPFILAGEAGTGKTFLAVEVIRTLLRNKAKIYIACPTGKAAVNFKANMGSISEHANICGVSTIHSMMYQLVKVDENSGIMKWRLQKKIKGDPDLIVCDEASMITRSMWSDILSWGLPVFVIGDDFQLPPVDPESNVPFSVLTNPTAKLTHVLRQSYLNPVIKVLSGIRSGIVPKVGFELVNEYGSVRFLVCDDKFVSEVLKRRVKFESKNIITLAGTNKLRHMLNSFIRRVIFEHKNWMSRYSEYPVQDDRVVFLKNNLDDNYNIVMNGQLGVLVRKPAYYKNPRSALSHLVVFPTRIDDNVLYRAKVYPPTLGLDSYTQVLKESKLSKKKKQTMDFVDFGYALTVHKSQGSEWDVVIMFNDASYYLAGEEYLRWLYTGLSRSKKHVLLLQPYSYNFTY